MNSSMTTGIVLSLTLASIFTIAGFTLIPDAAAYGTPLCKYSTNTVNWQAGANLTSTNYNAAKLAIANINDVGSNLFLDEVTSGTQPIVLYDTSHSEIGDLGYTLRVRTGSTCNSAKVFFNNAQTGGFTSQHLQKVASHEMLHAVGLEHTDSASSWKSSLMYPDDSGWSTYNVYVPTLDDIRALQSGSSYGAVSSTPECNTSVQSGSVTYTGTCSSGNAALPMTEKVTTAGSGNRAFAYDSTTSLPTSTALIITKVQPTTLYRFSTGVHTNTNVADGGSRYGTIELDDNGIKAAWSFLGVTQTATVWSGTPSTSTTYFLEILLQDGKEAAVWAFKDDGSQTTAPTWLGKATFTPSGSWSGTKYTGTGVWTDSGSNPKSDYQVKEFFNRQKSYT